MICGNTFLELDKALHDRGTFDCGEEELNDFLKTKALRHMKAGVSRTLALPCREVNVQGRHCLCAYFTVAPGSVARETFSEQEARRLPFYPVPVFLIAQLAVDLRQQSTGLGKITLVKALEYLWKVNAYMRANAVVVDCLTDKAIPFYEKYGFKSLGKHNGHERMFLPMKTVGRLFET